ncbi:dTDP-4-dehydrorhamnose reductase [Jeongeupia naejangsanensis]|nr:dTDP-4-dehydrorhamnose reductase [Jeongeupia naejangsanensis]
MRLLLLGAAGQLGLSLRIPLAALGEVIPVDRRTCDLTDLAALRTFLDRIRPDVIVNAAAYTAVDRAETDAGTAFAVNATAPAAMAAWAASHDALLLHYSTDYVFDGQSEIPYVETDMPSPLSVYGRSKLDGDLAIGASGCRHLILRTGWVYSALGDNFLTTILRLGRERAVLRVVDDQFGAPTHAGLIADTSADLLRRHASSPSSVVSGTYHLSAGGVTSWFGFAQMLLEHAASLQPGVGWAQVRPITSADYPQAATRPPRARLDPGKLCRVLGTSLPAWQAAVGSGVAEVLQR